MARVRALKAAGTRGFVKQTATEFALSEQRIKQIVNDAKEKEPDTDARRRPGRNNIKKPRY